MRIIKKKLLKYYEVIRITQNELFKDPARFLGRMIVHAVRISLFGIVYSYVYTSSGRHDINGFTALDAIWSIALIQLIYQCRDNIVPIKDDITSGHIETKINKPYSYVFYSFLEALGQAPLKFIGFIIVTLVVLSSVFGLPSVSILQITGFFILFILGIILYALIQQLIGLSAFWIENPDPVYWISVKMSWFINGSFVPLAILPVAFRNIANVFPLSAPFFVGRIFEIHNVLNLSKFILVQIFWIVIIVLLISIVYRKGITKLSINGG